MPVKVTNELALIVEPKGELWLALFFRLWHKESEQIANQQLLIHHVVEDGRDARFGQLGIS